MNKRNIISCLLILYMVSNLVAVNVKDVYVFGDEAIFPRWTSYYIDANGEELNLQIHRNGGPPIGPTRVRVEDKSDTIPWIRIVATEDLQTYRTVALPGNEWVAITGVFKGASSAGWGEGRPTGFDVGAIAIEVSNFVTRTKVPYNGCQYILEEPEYPELRASLKPDKLEGTASWRIRVQYSYNRNDDDWFPSAGFATLNASDVLNIKELFGNNFRGGLVTVYCNYERNNNIQNCRFIFHIRGNNPSATTVLNYITDPWYAENIVKHESRVGSATPHQFRPGNPAPVPDQIIRCPLRGGDAIGWGLMQLTHIELPGQTTLRMPGNGAPWPQELWNWKENIDTGLLCLERKREIGIYHLRTIAPDGAGGYLMPPTITVGNYSFTPNSLNRTPDQLEFIKLFNGGHFYTSYNPETTTWTHVAIQNDYTERVLLE